MPTVKRYINAFQGFLPGRRIILYKYHANNEDVCKVYFRRLINTDEIDISNFENTATKQIIKRDHSKWAIMKSEIIISMDALDMLASMSDNLESIEFTKIDED